MKFFNSRVLLFGAIVLTATLAYYYAGLHLPDGAYPLAVLLYLAAITGSLFAIKRNDPYEGYFGFNYHLMAYAVCNLLPLALKSAGVLTDVRYVSVMALVWGIGLLVHLVIWLVGFRKRRIGSYDKKELFS